MSQAPTGDAPTWDGLYRWALARLGERNEARWVVEEASGERLGAAVGAPPEKARRRLAEMVERRVAGEPLQYVLGSWSFRRLELMVDRRVLIPRPETEQVVEAALREIDRLCGEAAGAAEVTGTAGGTGGTGVPAGGDPPGKRATVVDLGTGSGAIALSLARERAGVEVWATDSSPGAVTVASANLSGLAGHAATRVRIVEGDWWQALPAGLRRRVDLVVSNPPYISSAEMADLDAVVLEWEPRQALESGPRGTEALEYLIGSAPEWLRPGGSLVLEMAPHQAGELAAVARRAGFAEVEVAADLAGRPRSLIGRGAP